MTSGDVELRCGEAGSWGLHARIVEANLIEVACDGCRRLARRQGRPVARVLHRFNIAGELVDTEEVPAHR